MEACCATVEVPEESDPHSILQPLLWGSLMLALPPVFRLTRQSSSASPSCTRPEKRQKGKRAKCPETESWSYTSTTPRRLAGYPFPRSVAEASRKTPRFSGRDDQGNVIEWKDADGKEGQEGRGVGLGHRGARSFIRRGWRGVSAVGKWGSRMEMRHPLKLMLPST